MRACLCIAVMVAACGPTGPSSGSSGIPGDKELRALTVQEATDLCYELAADLPERDVHCGDGTMFHAGYTRAACSNEMPWPAECPATVANLRDCASAFYGSDDSDLCMQDWYPPECDAIRASGECPI